MRLSLFLVLLIFSLDLNAQSLTVSDLAHIFKRLDEPQYVRKFLIAKKFKFFQEDNVMIFVECLDDSTNQCQKVFIDLAGYTLTYYSNFPYIDAAWGNQIVYVGYDYKGETKVAGRRKTRFALYGTNILITEDLWRSSPYMYKLEMYMD
jgi:hypothetical protein